MPDERMYCICTCKPGGVIAYASSMFDTSITASGAKWFDSEEEAKWFMGKLDQRRNWKAVYISYDDYLCLTSPFYKEVDSCHAVTV